MLLRIGSKATQEMLGRSEDEIKSGLHEALNFNDELQSSVPTLNVQISKLLEENKTFGIMHKQVQNEIQELAEKHDALTLKHIRVEIDFERAETEYKNLTRKYNELDEDNLRVKKAILPFIHAGVVPPDVLYKNPEDYNPPESNTHNKTRPYRLVTCPQCKEDGGAGGRCAKCAGSGTIRKYG